MARMVKTFRGEGMLLKRSSTGRTPIVTTDEKRRRFETVCPADPQAPAESQVLRWRLREFLSVQAGLAQIPLAFTPAIFQK